MSREPDSSGETTRDPFLGGRLQFLQPRRGYRFSVDAPLLAGFVGVGPDDRVADLGAGCGVVGILLAHFHPFRSLVSVEVQGQLAELARCNVRLNGFEHRIEVRHQEAGDFAAASEPGAFDLVVSNPPFHPVGSTRPSSDRQRAVARQEILLQPAGLFAAASRLLRSGGRLGLVHRPRRWPELRRLMEAEGLHPAVVRHVCPRAGEASNLVLIEAVKGSATAVNERPPLVLFIEPGQYTPEAEALLKGGVPLSRTPKKSS